MLFRLAESVVNIAHIPKEFLFSPESIHQSAKLPIAMSSSATATPSSLTSTSPPRCIALMARLFVDLSKVDHATITERAILG
jgi:hypothetical protein